VQEHHIAVTRTARYYTLGKISRGVGEGEVWFVYHGYGQLAARFLEKFRALDDGRRYLVAPEGLSRFYLSESPAERRVGASWMTREDRLTEIDDYVRYLDGLCEDVLRGLERRTLRVTALGFSQGTATVSRWASLGRSRVDRVVLWGGELPPDPDLAAVADRLRAVQLTLVYGRQDKYLTPKVIAATEARLREHAIPYQLVAFDGGHELNDATLTAIASAPAHP
jgi:predicted esterase